MSLRPFLHRSFRIEFQLRGKAISNLIQTSSVVEENVLADRQWVRRMDMRYIKYVLFACSRICKTHKNNSITPTCSFHSFFSPLQNCIYLTKLPSPHHQDCREYFVSHWVSFFLLARPTAFPVSAWPPDQPTSIYPIPRYSIWAKNS